MPLFDEVHAWTYDGGSLPFSGPRKRMWDSAALDLRIALRQARRFTFDDAFTRAVVARSTVQAPRMLANCHLANLPFDRVWIEYNMNARIDAQHTQGTGPPRDGEDRGPAAFLIERHRASNPAMFRISQTGYHTPADGSPNSLDPDCAMGPCAYVVDLSGMLPYLASDADFGKAHEFGALGGPSLPHGDERTREVENKMRAMGWGYFHQDDDGNLAYATTEELTRRGGVCLEGRFFRIIVEEALARDMRAGNDGNSSRMIEAFARDVIEGRGNLRFVITALAMMNVCPVTYVHREAKGFQRRRLRNIPYLDSHTITINCGSKRIEHVVDRAFRDHELAQKRKRHEVRGHWALAEYGKGGRACVHEPAERDGDYAVCGRCERLIHWRDHYERGDASLGYVHHDYEVKP